MSLKIGTTLGPYRIVGQLGSGGMGVVYRATDPRLKRTVAIKLLPPDLTRDETAKQRFLQEAQAASALDHRNICTINETDEGQLYLVMAHYEGETLKERIARGPLDLNDAIDIGAEIDVIMRWVDAGAPAGDVADAPPAKEWMEAESGGWSLGTPDFVVKMPEPYFVEDDIYDLNITFSKKLADADLPEDVWLRGWEFRTGDNRVTHHMCSSILPPSADAPADGTAVEDEGTDVRGRGAVCIAVSPRAAIPRCCPRISACCSKKDRRSPSTCTTTRSRRSNPACGVKSRSGSLWPTKPRCTKSRTTRSTTAVLRFRRTIRTIESDRRGCSRKTHTC